MGAERATRPLSNLKRPSGDGTLLQRPSVHRRLFDPNADKPRGSVNPLGRRKMKLPIEDLLNDEPERGTEILSQPETRPISHSQLAAEVKGIYAGLVMVEAKCVDVGVDETQSAVTQERPLNNEQWQALIALHRQSLQEHHDFFLASAHPSAGPNLLKLAAQYSMPARMWRHGIHAFLEVLRYRLPDSLDHMLAFIYTAYSMAALLYESVPFFKDTWLQCLGDLGRYRMAIEDNELKDKGLWSGGAHVWYNKAGEMSSTIGRIYHHFAIFARPSGLVRPLFNPALQGIRVFRLLSAIYTASVKAYADLHCVEGDLPWGEIAFYLNKLARPYYATAKVEAEEFPWHSKGIGRPLPEDLIIRGQIWNRGHFPNTWFEEAQLNDEGQSFALPSMAAPRVERELGLGAHITFFEKWIRNYMRKSLLSRWTSVMLIYIQTFFLLSHIPLVAARPQGNSEGLLAPGPSDPGASSASLATGVSSIIFVAAVLVAAHFLAKQKGPTPVYGFLMTALAFGWWVIRGDASTSLWCLGVVLILWSACTFHFAHHTCQRICTVKSATLISVILAILFDLAIVKFTASTGSSISQADILTLSLPSLSLGLGVTITSLTAIRHYPHDSQDVPSQQQHLPDQIALNEGTPNGGESQRGQPPQPSALEAGLASPNLGG